jgi:hypothetical protein
MTVASPSTGVYTHTFLLLRCLNPYINICGIGFFNCYFNRTVQFFPDTYYFSYLLLNFIHLNFNYFVSLLFSPKRIHCRIPIASALNLYSFLKNSSRIVLELGWWNTKCLWDIMLIIF